MHHQRSLSPIPRSQDWTCGPSLPRAVEARFLKNSIFFKAVEAFNISKLWKLNIYFSKLLIYICFWNCRPYIIESSL